MIDVAQELEKRYLPILRSMAQEIEAEFPNIRINVWSHSVGAVTEYQGHDIGIECLLPDTRFDLTDNIALSISVKHVTTIPKIDTVGRGLATPTPAPWSRGRGWKPG
jgi:hypothetical protein